MMKPVETTNLVTILTRYRDAPYRIMLAGIWQSLPVRDFLLLLRAVHAGSMPVDLFDAPDGLQIYDRQRQAPVGWIQPNPLRQAAAPMLNTRASDAKDKED